MALGSCELAGCQWHCHGVHCEQACPHVCHHMATRAASTPFSMPTRGQGAQLDLLPSSQPHVLLPSMSCSASYSPCLSTLPCPCAAAVPAPGMPFPTHSVPFQIPSPSVHRPLYRAVSSVVFSPPLPMFGVLGLFLGLPKAHCLHP